MSGQTLRWVRRQLAHSRAMQLFAGLLTVALTLPPQFGFAAELHYVRGGGKVPPVKQDSDGAFAVYARCY
ncbi:MAG: hypothetical protein KatS3mg016_0004 [Fimbriimonadales bacterium]|nr:MAG: hypothetical protein KatS3mg016_0004 [Fimbriimonadales bacterium]